MTDPEHTAYSAPPTVEAPLLSPGAHLAEAEVHLLEYLNILYRYRRPAITVVLLVLIFGVLQTYSAVPLYRANAQVLIEDERRRSAPFDINEAPTYTWRDPAYYQTQYGILRSRGLGLRVVSRPEIVKTLEGFIEKAPRRASIRWAVFSATESVQRLIRSWLGKPSPPVEAPAPGETARESALVGALQGGLQVQPIKKTRLLDIGFISTNPEFAALAANALAEEYVQQNLELHLENAQKALAWLKEEIARQQQKVQQSERALAKYRAGQNALALDDRQDIVVSSLHQLNDAVMRAQTARLQKETLYTQASADDPAAAETLPALIRNPYLQQLRARLLELQREKTQLAEKYGDRHPEMVRLNTSLDDVARQLREEAAKAVETLRNDHESALAEERALEAALEEQKAASMDLSRKKIDYTILEREAQTNRVIYERLLQREKELSVISNTNVNNMQLVDRADVPSAPFSPNTGRTLLMTLLAGLVLAVGLAFGLEYLDDTIKTPDDITRKLRLPFLGLVPAVRGERTPVISLPVPQEFGEAFRALRTSVVFATSVDKTGTILVTSTQPFEGKTTTACNLALVMALGGARVLLVEADMRRPGLHRTLGVPSGSVGLSHLLSGQAQVREAIQPTQDANLCVITAGQVPPNPSELLASDRMKELLARLAADGQFNWIVIDTPPLMAVTDPVVLAPLVSGVVFVLGSGMTRRRLAERAVEILRTAKPRSLSVVLNRVDFNRDKYYYSRYYGYEYRGYDSHATARV